MLAVLLAAAFAVQTTSRQLEGPAIPCKHDWSRSKYAALAPALIAQVIEECRDSRRIPWGEIIPGAERQIAELEELLRRPAEPGMEAMRSEGRQILAAAREGLQMMRDEQQHLNQQTARPRPDLRTGPPTFVAPNTPASSAGMAPGAPVALSSTAPSPPPRRFDAVPSPLDVVVGEVQSVAGDVLIRHGTAGSNATAGASVRYGDIITTGPTGRIQLRLRDDTIFTVGPNAEMTIDAFIFDPTAPAVEKTTIQLVAGAFRWVTGRIAAKRPCDRRVTIRDVGCICIRGTDFTLDVVRTSAGTGLSGSVAAGTIDFTDNRGRSRRISAGGSFSATSEQGGDPTAYERAADEAFKTGQIAHVGRLRLARMAGARAGLWFDIDEWQLENTPGGDPELMHLTHRSGAMFAILGIYKDEVLSADEIEPRFRALFAANNVEPALVSQEREFAYGIEVTKLRYTLTINNKPMVVEARCYTGPQGVAEVAVFRPASDRAFALVAHELLTGLTVR